MKRLTKATLWLVGSYLLFCLVALGAMLWGELNAQHVGDGTRADVALVLGAMQNPDGSLHPSTQSRVDRAVEFYQAGQIGVLVMCGGAPGEGRRATGALMAASAQAQGVPAEALRIEGDSHSTLQNTLFARPLVPQGATVWVLTEGYHLPRGVASTRFAGLPVDGYVSAGGWSDLRYAAWGAARELLAWPFNLVRGAGYLIFRALGVPDEELFPLLV